jgi:hypothetical protein
MKMATTKFNEDFKLFRSAEMLNDVGTLERPMQARKFTGQEVVGTRQENLLWRETYRPILDCLYEAVDNTEEILWKFIRLHDAPSDEILRFARKWGVLGICEHSFPATHNPPRMAKSKSHPACTPLRLNADNYWEPLQSWRDYSRQARGILRIAARLHQDKLGLKEDWEAVYGEDYTVSGMAPEAELIWQRLRLSFLVNDWLELGDVRPKFMWAGGGIGVSYYLTLFGVLASQLAFVISRDKGVGLCASCGEPYIPGRRLPKRNQRNYCRGPRCGKRGANRNAKRAQRLKQRNA